MSVNFGFSLPALRQYGAAGSNPFGQLGPTLDLSFVDGATGVTDLSNPTGYTLNTNFITPEYQVAAQYAVWENGVGLAQKTFAQIVTFSRTSGATWFNAAGNLVGVDFSVTSVTIGTGSKTFTLDATAGVNRSWATGDSVLISQQSNSANNMTGTVTSYTASTQVLVVDVTSTGGSGTIASWRVSSLMPRFDYNPSTLAAQGLLIEESRTNSIRNNTMQGAAAGTPGTAPTNWLISTATGNLTTREIVGTGTENGIAYIDVRFVASGAFTASIYADSATGVAASNGQTWTTSFYVKLAGGSLTNVTVQTSIVENDSGGNFLAGADSATFVPTSAALSTQRFTQTRTNTNASTAFEWSRVRVNFTNAGDVTLRIGLPQLEQGAFATSVIPTTTTALTRSADVASVNTLSPWFNSVEGTIYSEWTRGYTGNFINFVSGATISDGTNANVISSATTNGANAQIYNSIVTGSVEQLTYAFVNAGTTNKTAQTFKANDSQFAVNGTSRAADTTCTIPTVSKMVLGGNGIPNAYLNSWLRRVTFYPRRLSQAELESITT